MLEACCREDVLIGCARPVMRCYVCSPERVARGPTSLHRDRIPTEVEEWFADSRAALLASFASKQKTPAGTRERSATAADARDRLKDLATRGNDTQGISFAGDELQSLYYRYKDCTEALGVAVQ